MRLVWGTVTEVRRETSSVQRLSVALDDGRDGEAIAYPTLCGPCAEGDRVLLNTTAVELSLGTGGLHFVIARLGAAEGVALDSPSGGHVMKMRYTPVQTDVMSVEAPESEHHEKMREAESLESMPVVCCGLHSQLPLVAAAVKRAKPGARVALCMSDDASLPIALSDLVAESLEAGLLDTSITCGQAFGGQLEAVNLHSGLLAAKHVAEADVAIVSIGPGVVGSSTAFGHGGVSQGEAINAVGILRGTPIACLRLSSADARERHQGVSHHSLTALSRVALARAWVAIPFLPKSFSNSIEEQLSRARVWDRHDRADSMEGMTPPPSLHGIEVRSMGRSATDDPPFFAAAFAAGEIASRFV